MSESLGSVLVWIASDLEQRLYPFAGAIRRAARQLQELERLHADRPTDGCATCGVTLVQHARGRPRKFCGRSCADKMRRNAKVRTTQLTEVDE